jgi:hypothetical protein
MKDGVCSCLSGYSYDSTSKTCKILEIKKAVAQSIVIKNEPVKNIAEKTTPTKKSSDSLVKSTEKESLNNVAPKEELAPQITPESVKKLKWYQKIFNWFK